MKVITDYLGQVEFIAKMVHEINRAYCEAIGDSSQVPWEQAPQWQKDTVINGVKFVIKNPDVTPEQTHENWFKVKKAEGWVYGETKDTEAKTHPCMVPYNDLPLEQKVKDRLFKSVVKNLLKLD